MEVQDPSPVQPMRRRPRTVYKLKLGETFTTTFSIYFRYFLPLTLATIVVAALVLGADLLSIEQFKEAADPAGAWADAPASLLSSLSAGIAGYFLQGIFTFIVLQHVRGRSPGALSALGAGLRRTLPALPTALLAAGLVGALMFVGEWVPFLPFLTAIIMSCVWFVAVPVAAAEGRGTMEALGRSWVLTRGSKWRIFAIQNVIGIVWIGLASYFLFRLLDRGEAATFADLRWTILVMHVVTLPAITLLALAAPVAYHLLRKGKEGADIEEIASVFD